VSYLAALPGAIATIVCLAGLRVFSGLVFEPLIVRNAVSYGALGTVLIVQSWLIGVGWVLYGGQLFGRWFHDSWLRDWAESREGHEEAPPPLGFLALVNHQLRRIINRKAEEPDFRDP
jgi:membrane protein